MRFIALAGKSILARRSRRCVAVAAALLCVALAVGLSAGCGGGSPAGAVKVVPPAYGTWVSTLKDDASGLVSIACGGDVNFGDGVTPTITADGVDYPWVDAGKVFALADFSLVNLECCLSVIGSPVAGKEFTFRGPPDAAAGMARAGVKIVNLANNHAKDWGAQAFLDTLSNLKGSSIAWCGGGRNADEAYTPTVLEVRGKKVAFVGFDGIVPDGWPAGAQSPGVATTNSTQKVAQTIKRAADESDFVVASFHWGTELDTAPDAGQRSLAHLAVDNGADLVIGHHPHVVQGFEMYKNRLIAYSLGNFVFSPPREISSKTVSIIAVLGANGLVQAKVVPMVISNCRPLIMGESSGNPWLATVQGYSKALGTTVDIRGGRGFVNGSPPAAQPAPGTTPAKPTPK